ncbi:MAG: DNA primase, partial [Deltaproteobacteria bacterium CG23_combo_of_CG06-09_8_20_14_all_60_8]
MTTSPQRAETARLVKEAADIVTVIGEHVQLKRSGANLKGVCPFHAEKTPSFMVQPERQTFHCFGCGEGGDVFTFVMKYHNLTFPEALQELAQRFNVTLPERAGGGGQDQEQAQKRQALLDANEQAAILYHRLLLEAPEAADARAYLAKRGVPAELAERFRLGYAPNRWDFLVKALPTAGLDLEMALAAGLIVKKEHGGFYDRFRDRVQFPILNLSGQIVGFGGRILGDGQPKYLNSPESPVFEKGRVLFGLYQNREAVRQARRCLLVEGNFDLLALLAHGFANAAAPLGTALTPAHIRTLKGYCDETILLFDGDTAGEK